MQNTSQLPQLIHEYLESARLMQVATFQDNQPWACTVYFAFDENFHLYWISLPNTRHSQAIRNNPKVAGTIVLPHNPGDKVRGLQFEGVARELTERGDVEKGLQSYATRMKMPHTRVEKILDNTDGHLCYEITPTSIVLFDTLNFSENPRQEYKLK